MVKGSPCALTEHCLVCSSHVDPVLPRHCCQTLWGWRGDGNRLAAPRAREAACCPHGFTGRLCCGPADPATLPNPALGWMSPAAQDPAGSPAQGCGEGHRAAGHRAAGHRLGRAAGHRLGTMGRSSHARVPGNCTLNWTLNTADLSACQHGHCSSQSVSGTTIAERHRLMAWQQRCCC